MGPEYFVDSPIFTFILVLKNDQQNKNPHHCSDLSISILSCLLTQSILEKIEAIKHILLKASYPPPPFVVDSEILVSPNFRVWKIARTKC